jgi:hypothetical protein
MRAPVFVSLLLVVTTVVPGNRAAIAQSESHSPEELLVGTWVLDVPASRYLPGPPPRGEIRSYARGAQGINGIIKRTHADGHVETIEYLANSDQEHMVTGTPEYDAVKLRQIDPFTSEALLTHGGAIFGSATRIIGRDGKSMRIIFRRPDADVLNVAVYRKQEK